LKVPVATPAQADFSKRQISGSFDIAIISPGISIDDPSDQYSSILMTDGSGNYGKYSNQQVDGLLRQQDTELDVAKRRNLLLQVQRIQLTEFPTVPMFVQGAVQGTRPEVSGFVMSPFSAGSGHRLEGLWLEG